MTIIDEHVSSGLDVMFYFPIADICLTSHLPHRMKDRHQASRCDLTTARVLIPVAGHNATMKGEEVVSVSPCI